MKKIILIVLLLISIDGCSQKRIHLLIGSASEDKIKRTWVLSKFGIVPNNCICYTDRIQQLIDSAYNLEGVTNFKFETGTYHMKMFFDLTKKRQEGWIAIDFFDLEDRWYILSPCE